MSNHMLHNWASAEWIIFIIPVSSSAFACIYVYLFIKLLSIELMEISIFLNYFLIQLSCVYMPALFKIIYLLERQLPFQ